MSLTVALAWVTWVALGWRRRWPLPRPWDDSTTTPMPRPLERFGRSIQARVRLLADLAPITVGVVAVACALLLVVSPSVALGGAATTVLLAHHQARRVRSAARRRMIDQVPQALDLLHLCVEAGLSTRAALARLGGVVPDPLGSWCRRVSTRANRGVPLDEVLLGAVGRGHPMELAARTLASAERSGVAVADALGHLSNEARAAVRRSSLERVRQLPVRMLVPLVFCTLPAFLIVAVVPLIASQLGALR